MAMFLGEISFVLALAVFVAGMSLWHFGRLSAAPPLRAAGIVAMLGAAGAALCTGYYMVQYRVRGEFESAYSFRHGMGGAGMMEGEGMGHGMMERGRMMMPMQEQEMGRPTSPAPEGEKAHEQHHPEGESR